MQDGRVNGDSQEEWGRPRRPGTAVCERIEQTMHLPAFVGIATGLFSSEHLVDYRRCAADAGADGQCPPGAVALAGTAFDAGVTQSDLDLSVGTPEHLPRADGKTGAASVAFFRVMGEGDDVFKVDHGFHDSSTTPNGR